MAKKFSPEQIPPSLIGQRSSENTKRTMSIIDIYASAFLLYKNIQPTLELRGNKAVFIFEASSKVYDFLDQFNSNATVDVGDYVTAVRILRGKMLSMKEGMNEYGKGGGYGHSRK